MHDVRMVPVAVADFETTIVLLVTRNAKEIKSGIVTVVLVVLVHVFRAD